MTSYALPIMFLAGLLLGFVNGKWVGAGEWRKRVAALFDGSHGYWSKKNQKPVAQEPKPVARCRARDLDDAESHRCEKVAGHKGPPFNAWAQPDTKENPWERGLDEARFGGA